jgi:hypothetical protein
MPAKMIVNFLTCSLFLFFFFEIGVIAQTTTSTPVSTSDVIRRIFGPEPAPVSLPAGMTGPSVTDPRVKLAPGLFDAGESSFGLKHLTLVKKPTVFHVVPSKDPNDPEIKRFLDFLARPNSPVKAPQETHLDIARFIVKQRAEGAVENSDLAFKGNYLFQGNYYGISIYDISDPLKAQLLTAIVCPGGQGDPSVYKNLLFMSVESPNGRLDCGTQGFPPNPPPAAGQENRPQLPVAQKDRFRGVRIFDISDIRNPRQVAAVQTCRGSHTHTLVIDPKDKENVYIYVSGTSFVRPGEELAGCSDAAPDKDPNTALFRIEVIKVPLAAPQDAKVVSSPRVFMDSRTGLVNSLNNGGSHDGNGKPSDTNQCHDITVYSAIGLAAGACSGNGLILDIKDPINPKRLDAVKDTNFSYWHSASFSNDGSKVVFTDEWGGGGGARCRANDPIKWGADAIFHLKSDKLTFASYYKLPAAQSDVENCVAHNGSLIPVPGRDIEVQSWYQGGVSVMDFTDANNPVEIAYFDRGPIDPNILVGGGSWSAYWYNGHIYSSEIVRGLDILELTSTQYLTQNEIDAAKTVQVAELNVQNQQKIEWPRKLVVAKAYIDQLERSQAIPADQIAALRQSIQKAESSKSKQGKLKSFAPGLEKSAGTAKNAADSARLHGLAEILKKPVL